MIDEASRSRARRRSIVFLDAMWRAKRTVPSPKRSSETTADAKSAWPWLSLVPIEGGRPVVLGVSKPSLCRLSSAQSWRGDASSSNESDCLRVQS